MNNSLKKCYEAFERLKAANPTLEKYITSPPLKITNSVVSQEAGHDAGYLKASREAHKPLISMIELYVNDTESTTMGKKSAIKREKNKVEKAKASEKKLQLKLEESLGRELQLYHRLKETEEELESLKKEIPSPSIISI